jgi:2'-hydroxyisoflavone reductase
MSYPWVRDALRVLGPAAGHWTFVSSVNVYSDVETVGQTAAAPVREPLPEGGGEPTPERYGAIKVASENAVRAALGDRAFVVRPGLITGPGDEHDRFGYWVTRMSAGGRVAVPGASAQPIQYVDVRDLAGWITDAGERGLVGTFDGVGPAQPLTVLLADIAALVAPEGTELVWVAENVLRSRGVTPWAGPMSLPLWAPPGYYGFCSHDVSASLAAGLRQRPLADAVAGALDRELALGLDRPRKAGLTRAEEAGLLG